MMRLGGLLVLVLCFLFHGVRRLPAEENPRALIDRALKAQGGEAKLAQLEPVALKYKGSFHVGDTEIPFTGEIFSQNSDRYKQVIHFSIGNEKMTQVIVFNGNKAWVLSGSFVNGLRIGDQALDMNDDVRAELQKER